MKIQNKYGNLINSNIQIGDIGMVKKGSWIGDEITTYSVWAKVVNIDEDNTVWLSDSDGYEFELFDPIMFRKEKLK